MKRTMSVALNAAMLELPNSAAERFRSALMASGAKGEMANQLRKATKKPS